MIQLLLNRRYYVWKLFRIIKSITLKCNLYNVSLYNITLMFKLYLTINDKQNIIINKTL